jgi:hypothetical protein
LWEREPGSDDEAAASGYTDEFVHPNTHSELRDPSGLRTLWQNRSFAGSGEADPEA